ncbi:MAG: SUMF1/EgtB/PvdO family nonheme iron enzyme [bacterium]
MKQSRVHTIVLKALAVCMVIVFVGYSGIAARSAVSDCIHHGDVNLDARITAADAQLAFFITLGQYSPTYEEECAADCDGSGRVTSADAQLIFLTVLGTGACEDPLGTPTPTLTPMPGDLVATDPIVVNMRFVPAGSFTQGSPNTEPCRDNDEGPQFTHILTRNLAVMETAVSRQMWADLKAVQGTLPADPSDTDFSPTMNHPVQQNIWNESVLFANLLSLQNGFAQCYYTDAGYTIPVTDENYMFEPIFCNFNADGYRLPTEGEWEYFARAGTSGPFSCDERYYNFDNCFTCEQGMLPTLEQYCVFCANSSWETAVVGSKLPNPWNLKDVHGNVFEWCWDWYVDSYPSGTVTDYVGPSFASGRIYRGGSWDKYPMFTRSAFRGWNFPTHRSYGLGFRLVRTVSF